MGPVGVFFVCWLYPVDASAAMWSGTRVDPAGSSALRMGFEYESKVIPPFRAAARDRAQASVRGHWKPDERVRLDASWSWLRDQLPSGMAVQGPGDVRLGAHAVAWESPVAVGLGWSVKLPNAADEGEIGTDETDATVVGTFSFPLDALRVFGAGGLVIQGDPIRFANQDDAGMVVFGLSANPGSVHMYGQAGGTLQSARNPARMSAQVGASMGCPIRAGVDLQGGLTSAAPAWGGGIWVGWEAGCD